MRALLMLWTPLLQDANDCQAYEAPTPQEQHRTHNTPGMHAVELFGSTSVGYDRQVFLLNPQAMTGSYTHQQKFRDWIREFNSDNIDAKKKIYNNKCGSTVQKAAARKAVVGQALDTSSKGAIA